MGYTKYGEFIRVLRVKHHEVMGDTAKLLKEECAGYLGADLD